ncbi:probable hexosyltransferase MUCI70 [Magnolia sinica]|uniref:probable hexosyltransferase MUCI70 n=1 Tax=Magnolia sinica TaxID=86752 RepID=UPI002659B852|nr:probable hexosyltransferase MUCI70 [Magnolia sinica]
MTGGSLGLRTGSYGSLQQQQLLLQNSVAVAIQTMPVSGRKPPKMLLPGLREKERCRPWICKITGRRRVGMLFLVIISAAVFTSLMSAFTKDEDADGPDIRPKSSQRFEAVGVNGIIMSSYYESPLISGERDHERDNKSSSLLETNSGSDKNTTIPPPPPPPPLAILSGGLLSGHPCEHFAFPPPSADRKRIGPRPCPVCYLPVDQAMMFMPTAPSVSPVLKNLTYATEENSISLPLSRGSPFGGYPSLEQRNDSFNIKESMNVHCGFVKGDRPGHQTGFDMDDADLLEMEKCHGIVVASAIFGNYDMIQQPKNCSEAAKRNVCFYMFLDEETEAYMKNSSLLDNTNRVGLWRVVIIHNLPYDDARRNGKVLKLLLHRIFPNAQFSIWVDGKLELVVDPYQILERFLWRQKASFAISRHYRRFDVFEEAEANKAAGKYDNASIDYQIEFYKREGLTRYSPAKLPITSDVPEGCVIIREHIPITNLFTCLWFNEVDRFTSRDQISFSTVRDKIMSKVNWSVNMFMDCERRNFVVQGYHRDILEQMNSIAAMAHPPPHLRKEPSKQSSSVSVPYRYARSSVRKIPTRRGRERRSGKWRHRTRTVVDRESNSF